MVFDSKGTLTSFNSQNVTAVQMGGFLNGQHVDGNDGIIAWGTFESTTPSTFGGNIIHFVMGLPAPSNLGGTTGTYSLIGATSVTDLSDKGVGALNSATLSFTIGASNPVSAAMIWTINGSPLTATLLGNLSNSIFSLNSSLPGGSCTPNCTVQADGALFGTNAERAGMVYGINSNMVGAAAFAKH
jgi:hypothetical protein